MGCAHVYTDPTSGIIPGAEIAAPEAEHLAQLLSLAILNKMTDSDLLRMPFYHPTMGRNNKRLIIDSIKKRKRCNRK